jgi:hypothetical protein
MATPVVVSRIQNRRGTQTQFDNLYPPGYTGTGGVDINVWPNILLPGELALTTDTRRAFLGNLNGEYIELSSMGGSGILLPPLVVILPPTAIFTAIPELDLDPTPFFTLFYDITDSLNPDWNTVGTNFARNGEMKITAIADNVLPPIRVGLTDISTDVNLDVPDDISFMADYNIASTKIEILYKHDFATSLTFSTSTLRWLPF